MLYAQRVPKLWSETIQAHRHEVREAILDTTWGLVAAHGMPSVTMSQIAKEVGIGRATLYKYFSDVESILTAWHQRHIADHLERLAEIGSRHGTPLDRLEAVLKGFALICHDNDSVAADLDALLHRDPSIARARQQLVDLIRDLLVEVEATGWLRDDVAPDELASYCFHALSAAEDLPSRAASLRLVTVTLAGLRPPSAPASRAS
jgi:AcrR family transcriptional regulator